MSVVVKRAAQDVAARRLLALHRCPGASSRLRNADADVAEVAGALPQMLVLDQREDAVVVADDLLIAPRTGRRSRITSFSICRRTAGPAIAEAEDP